MDERIKQQIELYDELVVEATQQITPTLIEMRRIAVEIFGESYVQIQPNTVLRESRPFDREVQDRWDRYVVKRYMNSYGIYRLIIHFPKITITNDEDLSNEIVNLFVGLGINDEGRIVDLRGIRPTYRREEYDATYAHSHISGIATKWYQGAFCTGSGPINQSLLLNKEEPFNEIEFRLLCYHIRSLVKYESLEGTPYRYIRDIGEISDRDLYSVQDVGTDRLPNLIKQCLIDLRKDYSESYLKDLMNFHVTKDGIKVKPRDELGILLGKKLLEYINNKLFNMTDDFIYYLLAVKKNISTYYRLPSLEYLRDIPSKELVINFKGVDYNLDIIDPEPESESKNIYYAHPDFTLKFCEQLSNYLTQAGYKFNAVYK